jgi:Co/Zn/Cd efflux system component
MKKTTFRVLKMDCPSEEHMIRMKLAVFPDIRSMEFDIPNRMLTICHPGDPEPIFRKLDDLKFDSSLINSVVIDDQPVEYDSSHKQKRLLWQVLGINFFFFILEMITGFFSGSMGLLADSLDMLADSFVYALALLAVGAAMAIQKRIARAAGYLQMVLAILGFIEVVRRFTGNDILPSFQVMIVISALALTGNALCLYLLQKSKSQEAHMRASMIFTSNDVIVNLGVIFAGSLVYLTGSAYPDLVIGTLVFILVGMGALKIMRLVNE